MCHRRQLVYKLQFFLHFLFAVLLHFCSCYVVQGIPYRQLDIDKLEKVQKRATKMTQGIGNFKYPERLRQ